MKKREASGARQPRRGMPQPRAPDQSAGPERRTAAGTGQPAYSKTSCSPSGKSRAGRPRATARRSTTHAVRGGRWRGVRRAARSLRIPRAARFAAGRGGRGRAGAKRSVPQARQPDPTGLSSQRLRDAAARMPYSTQPKSRGAGGGGGPGVRSLKKNARPKRRRSAGAGPRFARARRATPAWGRGALAALKGQGSGSGGECPSTANVD